MRALVCLGPLAPFCASDAHFWRLACCLRSAFEFSEAPKALRALFRAIFARLSLGLALREAVRRPQGAILELEKLDFSTVLASGSLARRDRRFLPQTTLKLMRTAYPGICARHENRSKIVAKALRKDVRAENSFVSCPDASWVRLGHTLGAPRTLLGGVPGASGTPRSAPGTLPGRSWRSPARLGRVLVWPGNAPKHAKAAKSDFESIFR